MEGQKKRLIDADALCNLERTMASGKKMEVNFIPVSVIKNAPTIDAVPVVRCKDCKHSTTFHHTGNMYCGLHENHHFLTDAYGFCNKGERRCD